MEKRIPNLAPRISQEYRKQRSISSSRRRGFNTQRQTETLMENDSHRKPDICILKYLNKEESKVILMREFEISLFQTQCLPIIR